QTTTALVRLHLRGYGRILAMSTSVDWSGAAPPWVPLCLASPLNLSGMSISTGRASGSLRHTSPTTTTTWGPPR
ncbi:hypothetical protein B5X24_HaOG212762, partial [Helicoverpa armigera]